MPTETFFRLPEEKRQKVLAAIYGEFSSYSFDQVSINRIVQHADIPRGSFYQYFKDKNDLFFYLLSTFSEQVLERTGQLLAACGGDVFSVIPELFDWIVQKLSAPVEGFYIYKRLLGSLRLQDQCFIDGCTQESISSYGQFARLLKSALLSSGVDAEAADTLVDVLQAITYSSIAELFIPCNELTQVRERLIKRLNFIKRAL